jgi:alkaline phosphatase D
VSCNDYQHGLWGAFNGLADEDLDFWVHVGDYIYEYGPNPSAFRQHDGEPTDSIETLEQYRNRWALYRLDPALQAAHASAPVFWVPDDHEVENNHAGLIDEEEDGPTARFARQKAAAWQAAWEHLPMPRYRRPEAEDFRLYRSFRYGSLASVQLLDTRQYRDDQDAGDGLAPRPAGLDPDRSMLGALQERRVRGGLVAPEAGGGATWKVLAQQMVMTETAFVLPDGSGGVLEAFNMDAWDGYVATRERLLNFVADRRVDNVVVLAGDIHSTWINDLCTDYERPDETVVASELVATGISSNFPGQFVPLIESSLPANPQVKYFNAGKAERASTADEHHGYLSHRITPEQWTTEVRQVANITDASAPMSTVSTWAIEAGRPGPQEA